MRPAFETAYAVMCVDGAFPTSLETLTILPLLPVSRVPEVVKLLTDITTRARPLLP